MSSPSLSAIDPATCSSRGITETQGTATLPAAEDSNVLSTRQVGDQKTALSCTTSAAKSLACPCYNDQVTRIAEMDIDTAHYQLEMGVIYLLDEEEAMEKARSRATDVITAAAQDAMRDVIDAVGHEEHNCRPGETAHLTAWQRWHVEWKCDRAARQFRILTEENPRREHDQQRRDREIAGEEAKRGSNDESRELERTDDVRESRIMITPPIACMPYPGCECVLWGTGKMASTVWNEAVSSFDEMYPIASDWGDLLLANIEESTEVALEEVREIVLELGGSKGQKAGVAAKTTKEHFPEWQQVMVKERVDIAVDDAKKRIILERGAPGAVAKAEAKDAEEHCYQYRMAAVAKEAVCNKEERSKESLGATKGSHGGLAAVEKVVGSAEIT